MSIRLGLAASLLGAFTAISRVVVDVHYCHDILTRGAPRSSNGPRVCSVGHSLIGKVLALAERSPTLNHLLTGNYPGRYGQTSVHPGARCTDLIPMAPESEEG